MIMKIYLVFMKYKDDDPVVSINVEMTSAIDEARNKIFNQSEHKRKIREFEVTNFPYFAVNLAEGMMAWVEEKEIVAPEPVFATSSVPVYSMRMPE